MQTTGYLIIGGQKVLILVRHKRYSRLLKIRKSGRDGQHFEDEEHFLSLPENRHLLEQLLRGETIEV